MDIPPRIFKDRIDRILGVPMVVVNNTAGGGTVGTLTVFLAKPDGYTLLYGSTGPLILQPMFSPELPYRYTEFTPICQTIVVPVVMLVQNEAPWKSLKELVDYGRKNPGALRGTVSHKGSSLFVLTELFKAAAGVDITVIPTKSGVSQSAALMGGHAELCTDTVATNISFLRAGRLRALACTHKLPEFPMIKTFAEEGYPAVSLKVWQGIFAPKGLPKPILTKLTTAFEKASNDPSLRDQLGKQYMFVEYLNPEETSTAVKNEHEITLKILKQTGMVK